MAIPTRLLTAVCNIDNGTLTAQNRPPVFTGESGAMEVSVTFKKGGESYTIPSGVVASLYLYYPNTELMTIASEMAIDGATATGTLTEAQLGKEGYPMLMIQLADPETESMIVAASFPIKVTKSRGSYVVDIRPPSPSEIVYVGRSPYINTQNDHWMQWDSGNQQYEDTGVKATGYSPYINSQTDTWMVWDETAGEYVDTHISATGTNPIDDTAGTGDTTKTWSADKLVAQFLLKADKSDTYTKAQIDSMLTSIFRFKGTKATYAEIEALTEKAVGDVWCCSADSSEYAWTGSAWEKLGPMIDLSPYLTSLSIAGITIDATHTTVTSAQLLTALGVYTKTEVDTALAEKANASNVYNKTEIDSYLSAKANTSDVNAALATKANQSTTYTKDETDTAISTAISPIPKTAAELPMSANDSQKIKDVLESQYVRTVNNMSPVNGNVNVSGGSGSSVGLYQVDATIPTTAWTLNTTSQLYEATISSLTGVTNTMTLMEMWVDGDPVLYPVDVTVQNGSILLEIEEAPLVAWNQAHIVVGVNGASVLDDVTQDRADIVAIKTKMGYSRTMTMVGAVDMVDAINKLDARPSGGGSGSFGMIPINANIATTDWTLNSTTGKYEATITNANVTSNMSGLEAWLDDESLQPDEFEILAETGGVKIISSEVPASAITIHIVMGTDGADTLADVSALQTAVSTLSGSVTALGPYNGLDSDSIVAALSAAQGKALNNSIAQIANKLGFSLNYKGVNPQDWTTLFPSSNNCIDIYAITGQMPKGSPTDAYSYGILIVLTLIPSNPWTDTMIYISDYIHAQGGLYIKNKGKTSWSKISGTSVADKT